MSFKKYISYFFPCGKDRNPSDDDEDSSDNGENFQQKDQKTPPIFDKFLPSQFCIKLHQKATKFPNYNHAMGSLLGAFIGDALGAPLEFSDNVSEAAVSRALTMSGGGPFKVAPGQITDDSEMALSLARGLTHDLLNEIAKDMGFLDLNLITLSYREWVKSVPFDIGITTQLALNLGNFEGAINGDDYKRAAEASENMNKESLSNGALMRITPLAVWCLKLKDKEDIFKAVELENKITHSNRIVHIASFVYVLAIRWLIKKKGDIDLVHFKIDHFLTTKNKENDPDWAEVYSWWLDTKKPLIPARPNEGYIKIAWIYAFSIFIDRPKDFESGIREVLLRGGDTDTNACIYGGMLGAAFGFQGLPNNFVDKVINCKHERQVRPTGFHPKNIGAMASQILRMAPMILVYKTTEVEGFRTRIDVKEVLRKIDELAGGDGSFNDKILGFCFGLFFGDMENLKTMDPGYFSFLQPILEGFGAILRHKNNLQWILNRLSQRKDESFELKLILAFGTNILVIKKGLKQENIGNKDLLILCTLALDLILCKTDKEINMILEKNHEFQCKKFDFDVLIYTLMKVMQKGSSDKFEDLIIKLKDNRDPLTSNICGGFLGLILGFRYICPKLQTLKIWNMDSFLFFQLYPVLKSFIKVLNLNNKISEGSPILSNK